MKALDFVIIGAQKCATTTLFELLRQHPDVDLPLEKEVPFFHRDHRSPQAWQVFSERYYGADDGRLRGKVSPQYMADPGVAARLAAAMPDVRLIAVLRDPVERARSHFRMGRRRAAEHRDFATAVAANLDPARLQRARTLPAPLHQDGYESEGDFYVAWSEYGRILSSFRSHFESRQMLVIYTEALESDPRGVLEQVLTFLGLSRDFHPKGLGQVMHAGGGSNRIPHGMRVWLRERALVAGLWRLVPAQQQGRMRFLYERWNSRKTREPLPLPDALQWQLRAHFAADLDRLAGLGLGMPDWAAEYGATATTAAPQNANIEPA